MRTLDTRVASAPPPILPTDRLTRDKSLPPQHHPPSRSIHNRSLQHPMRSIDTNGLEEFFPQLVSKIPSLNPTISNPDQLRGTTLTTPPLHVSARQFIFFTHIVQYLRRRNRAPVINFIRQTIIMIGMN
jgi:hypothetical protein